MAVSLNGGFSGSFEGLFLVVFDWGHGILGSFYVRVGLTMRHTPAFGHPSPRGDGAAARQSLNIDNQNDAAAHPLSERGGRRPGCVALSNRPQNGPLHFI